MALSEGMKQNKDFIAEVKTTSALIEKNTFTLK